MKWPFIKRKKHEAEIIDLIAAHARERQRLLAEHEEQMEKLFKPLLKKFLRIQADYDVQRYDKYMVSVAMDSYWVEHCLLHGNSQRELETICKYVAHQVEYELNVALKARNILRSTVEK